MGLTATLARAPSSPDGVFGRLVFPGFSCYTVEMPWKGNQRNKSCIPLGVYECVWRGLVGNAPAWRVLNVPGRTGVLIHIGNHAGDVDMGRMANSEGCILPGSYIALVPNVSGNRLQFGVGSSRAALEKLYSLIGRSGFTLSVVPA
jgi:hypothetical protein